MSRSTSQARWLAEARDLIVLAGPLIAAQVASISMNTVDAVMSGQLGKDSMAAVALGGGILFAVIVFAMGTMIAISPTVSHLFGEGRHAEVGHQVRQGLWMALGASVPTILILISGEWILRAFDTPAQVIPLASGYLRAIAWGIPFFLGYTVLKSYCEGVSDPLPILLVSLLGLGSNIVLNWMLMYGRLGCPRLGAVGTGVASAIVMGIMFVGLAAWISLSPKHRPFGCFQQFDWPCLREQWSLVRLGAPIGTSMFLECSLFTLVALKMGSLGTVAVAAHQIALNFAANTFMIPLGIAMAITARVGQSLGRGDPLQARRFATIGFVLSVGVMTIAAVVMLLIPRQIAWCYIGNDVEVQSLAVALLSLAAIFQISDGLQVSSAAALRGLKDTTAPMLITLMAYWGVGLPLAIWMGFRAGLGARGLWMGLIAGLTVAAVLLNVRFWWNSARLIRRSTAEEEPSAVVQEVEADLSACV